MAPSPSSSSSDNEKPELIAHIKTAQGLTLMLYNPLPEFALVCFDQHPTRTAPLCFQRAADALHYQQPLGKELPQWKFVQCHANEIGRDALAQHQIVEFPTYVVYHCGPDALELARLTSANDDKIHRDKDHTGALRQLAIGATQLDPSSGRDVTPMRLAAQARAKVDTALLYLSRKFDISPPFKLSTYSHECTVKIGENHICITAGNCRSKYGSRDGTCQFRAYIGAKGAELKRNEGGESLLLRELLLWNFNGDFLNGFTLGVEQRTGKFTVECTKHILEQRFNEMTFENLLFNFSNAVDATKKRILDFRLKVKGGGEVPKEGEEKKEEDKNETKKEATTTTTKKDDVASWVGQRGVATFGVKNPRPYACVVKADNKDGTIKVQWVDGGKFTKRLPVEKFQLDTEEDDTTKKEATMVIHTEPPSSARELRERRLARLGCSFREEEEEDPTECSSRSSQSSEEDRWRCKCCRKEFHSQNQLSNHLRSKKHKRAWKQFQEEQGSSSLSSASSSSSEEEATLVTETGEEETLETEPKKRKYVFTKEQRDRRQHRKLLKELIAQDKEERRANGGKLKSKLGLDGYRPTGTHFDIDK